MLSVAARIIEAVDVFKYCHLYRPPCLPSMTPDKFSLDGFEKLEAALEDRQTPDNAKTAELAALATRSAKKSGVDRSELREQWRSKARKLGISERDMASTVTNVTERGAIRLPGVTRDGV